MPLPALLHGSGTLIVDRDPLYTAHFRTLLHRVGRIGRRERLGRLLSFYERNAA